MSDLTHDCNTCTFSPFLSLNAETNGHKSAFLFQNSSKLIMISAPHQY